MSFITGVGLASCGKHNGSFSAGFIRKVSRHSGAPRSGEPGIQLTAFVCGTMDSGLARRAPRNDEGVRS